MSMISGLIDELNKSADEWNGSNMFELARMCREAADTIWQLRDDLQRANAENAKLRDELDAAKHDLSLFSERIVELGAENAKLRELVLDYFNAPCLECDPWAEGWEGCKHCESGNCTLAVRTLELGIEVDDA